MQKSVISIGDRIELVQTKSALRSKKSDAHYTSQLLEYDGIRTIKILMPISEGRVVPLEVNDEYELCFFTAKGMYRCTATILRRYREKKIFVLQMQMTSKLTKFQRRQFYRLDCSLDIQYRVVSEEEMALQDLIKKNAFSDSATKDSFEKKLKEFRKNWSDARITDLSGGGMRFQCQQELEKNARIEVRLPLFDVNGNEIRSMAMIIAVISLPGGGRDWEARCQFDAIDKKMQERIIKYIFDEQKRRIRKD